jgi:hypothetical protein
MVKHKQNRQLGWKSQDDSKGANEARSLYVLPNQNEEANTFHQCWYEEKRRANMHERIRRY